VVIEAIGIAGACKPASVGTVGCRRGVTTGGAPRTDAVGTERAGVTTGGAPRTDAVGTERAGVLTAGFASTPATLQT